METIQSELLCHILGDFLAVSREHHFMLDSQLFKFSDSFCTVFLDHIVDDDVSGVAAVYGDMDYGAGHVAGMPASADSVHHPGVAHTDDVVSDARPDTHPGHLLNFSNLAAVRGFLGEGVAQCRGHRMRRVMLDMRSHVQQMVLVAGLGMDGFDEELSMSQGTSLVEHHRRGLGKGVHVIGSLDEDAFARSAAYASEEGQGHADDQRAGAGNNEKHQRTIEPGRECTCEITAEKGREKRQCERCEHHDRRIDAGEAGDEGLAMRLAFACVLDKFDDARDRALTVCLGGAEADDSGEVHAAGKDLVAGLKLAGDAFARKGLGVHRGRAFDDGPVERDFLSRPDDKDFSNFHARRIDGLDLSFAFDVRHVGTDIHEVGNAVAAFSFGIALEQFSYLEEKHDEYRFGESGLRAGKESYAECPYRGDRHKEMLVEGVAVRDALDGFLQRVEAYDEVGDQIDQQELPGGQVAFLLDDHRCGEQNGRQGDQDDLSFQASFLVMMLMLAAFMLMVMMFV